MLGYDSLGLVRRAFVGLGEVWLRDPMLDQVVFGFVRLLYFTSTNQTSPNLT
jgi:hypothetical protein